YGAEPPQGAPIPPNADLIFEVEVIDIMSQQTFERNLGILQQAMQSQMGGAPGAAPNAGPAPAPAPGQ
ncbi:MAG TPA: peptidylprolyl isomerase, partial [Erythrobacter sp.]|nr:peptidylprolyl isomerase [Erythrobacter sp.]